MEKRREPITATRGIGVPRAVNRGRMDMSRKIFALLLACVLLTLSACSSIRPEPAPEPTEEPAELIPQAEETEAAPEPTPQERTEADDGSAYYSAVTAMPREDVESLAARVRQAYLEEDWAFLAGMIRCPITMDGTELEDADAFLAFAEKGELIPEDREAMEKESCRDMLVTLEGICMGSGQIWLNAADEAGTEPTLQIVALSGIRTAAEPEPTPAPGPDPNLPKLTKQPTDETVDAWGDCWFIAKHERALQAEWHFVSPDGNDDIVYSEINAQFPDLVVVEGFSGTTHLIRIPPEMNGWKVYCRFSNNYGSVDTDLACIYVKGEDGQVPSVTPEPEEVLAPEAPDTNPVKVTKEPMTEYVDPGGDCWFIAKAVNAIRAEWHFLSPNGKEDYKYDEVGALFPGLQVIDGDTDSLQLKNIPQEMTGWKVYCRFSNGIDVAETTWAEVRVEPPPVEP